MRESQETEINGHHYLFTPFQTSHGLRMSTRLGKIVAPALGMVVDAIGFKLKGTSLPEVLKALHDRDLGKKFFQEAIAAFLDRIGEDEVISICKEFSQACKARIKTNDALSDWMPLRGDTYEMHFQGDMEQLVLWMQFCIKVQFKLFGNA